MTITARYPSTCASCGARITPGQSIEWQKGVKTVRHTDCAAAATEPAIVPAARPRRSGSRYTRFSSGAEYYQNDRGRCEDAPACGCCS